MPNRIEHHLHTMYSFLDGVGFPQEYVKRAKELGMTSLGISDHGSTMGLFHFYEACKEEGIKPLLGIEFYACREFTKVDVKSKTSDKTKKKVERFHLIAIAKNQEGYRNLLKLASLAYDTFNYRPILRLEDLLKNKDNLIITSACIASLIQTEEDVQLMKKEFGDDFYLEIQPLDLSMEWNRELAKFDKKETNKQIDHNRKIIGWSRKYKVPLLVSMDVHYPLKEDKLLQDIFILNSVSGKDGWHFSTETHYLMSADEVWAEFLKHGHSELLTKQEFDQAMQNSLDLAAKVEEYDLDKLPVSPPKFPLETHPLYKEGDKAYDLVVKSIQRNAKLKDKGDEYIQRLVYELKIITDKNFLDYFLIIEDIINWCKNNDIMVGPGRGSAAGSLLAYALDITKMDPIIWNLPFERFLDIDRTEYPDIDLDFEDQDKVKTYLREKYGYDKVMDVGIYQTIKTKTAIKDTYRVLRKDTYSFQEINDITKDIPNSGTGEDELVFFKDYVFGVPGTANEGNDELQKYFVDNPDIFDVVRRILGKVKLCKVHPCAMIISNQSLDGVIPTVINKVNTKEAFRMTGYDGEYCAKSGLLKFDILSLGTLKDIKGCQKYIKERKNIDVDVWHLEPDDPEILKRFREGDTESVFQYNTVLSTPLVKSAKVDRFEDLSAITALGRPGPIGAGLAQKYVDNKLGRKIVVYAHPLLKEILEGTFGVTIYQEQIMEIFQKLGGFSAVESNKIRKAVSKFKQEEITKAKSRFIEYATTKLEPPMRKDAAEGLFKEIEQFGNYCFNKAHSCSYAYVGYGCQYLKTYYPEEWWASVLQNSDKDKVKSYIQYLKDWVVYPEINKSKESFIFLEDDRLMMPLRYVNQVGPNAIKDILAKQPFANFKDFFERVEKRVIKKNVVENLILAETFRDIEPDKSLRDLLMYYYYLRGEEVPEKFIRIDDKVYLETLKHDALVFHSTNWTESFAGLFSKEVIQDYYELQRKMPHTKVKVGGRISSVEYAKTKTGKDFARLSLNNDDQYVTIYVWEDRIPVYKHEMIENALVEISGTTSKFGLALNSLRRIVT